MFFIRKDEWKYVYFPEFEPLLFNLKEDPHELRNLSHDPEQRERITELHHRLLGDLDVERLTEEIKQEFLAYSGVQFDPNLTSLMLHIIEEENFAQA